MTPSQRVDVMIAQLRRIANLARGLYPEDIWRAKATAQKTKAEVR